jgi:protein-S-isoprenylcysteine O-methyltransferase Ste14
MTKTGFAIGALVVYGVWFAAAFGARTVVAIRRTGDSGWRGISGRPFTAEWFARVLFVLALVVGVGAPVAQLAGINAVIDSTALGWLGIVVAGTGVALTLAAQMSMGDSWRIGVDTNERTALVTGGALALARNPIFAAMAVTAVGLAAMVPNLVAITGVVALVVALELQVRAVEEPYLVRIHRDAYLDYANRVGRLLPGIGRNVSRRAATQ